MSNPYLEEEIRRCAAIMEQDPTAIFVFGSNREGIHGSGAARTALDLYGAELGVGEGRTGRCYALPTKYDPYTSMDLRQVQRAVRDFLIYARRNPDVTFAVTRVGCGLAGFTDAEISPLFVDAPDNCELPAGWGDGSAFQRFIETNPLVEEPED